MYWLLNFNQILILLTSLVTLGLVIVVRTSLDSGAAYTITTEPWVSKTVNQIKIWLKYSDQVMIQ